MHYALRSFSFFITLIYFLVHCIEESLDALLWSLLEFLFVYSDF